MSRLSAVLERRGSATPAPPRSARVGATPPATGATGTKLPPPGPVGLLVQHGLLALATAAAMRPLWLLYGPAPRPHLLAVGAAALAIAAGVRQLRWSATSLALVLLASLPGAVLAFGGKLSAIIEGPALLLSMRPPLVPSGDLVTVLIAATWLAATVAAVLAAAAPPVLAVLGPLALLLGGALAAAPYRVAELWWGALVAGLGLLAAAVARWSFPTSSSGHQQQPRSIWVAAVVLAAAAGLLGAAAGAGFERISDPAALRQPPSQGDDTLVLTNPLASIKSIRADGVTDPLVTVRADDGVVAPVRLVAFDEYDGVRWTTAAVLERSGERVGGASLVPGDRTVGYELTLSARYRSLPALSPFVPLITGDELVARATSSLSGSGLLSDAEGAVVVGAAGAPPLADYRVEARVTERLDREAATFQPLLAESTARFLAVPEAPRSLDAVIEEALARAAATAQPAGSPGEQLEAVRALLVEEFAHNPEAVPGHSVARLDAFLSEQRAGSAEQFSATFALVARRLGFPARVAVGFRLTDQEQEQGTAVADGSVAYSSTHLTAWPEIAVADIGWVTVDVLPDQVTPTPVVPPAIDDDAADRSLTPTRDSFEDVPEQLEDDASGATLSAAALVGVVIVAPLAIVTIGALAALLGAKRRRRRLRRRRGDPGDRTLGAWAELRDRLLEHGVPMRRGLSPSEQIDLATEHLGPEMTADLPTLVDPLDWAVYDPTGPSDAAATAAWQVVDGYRQRARQRLPVGRRLRAAVDPRPLFQHRR